MSKLSPSEGECYIWSTAENKPIPAKWTEAWANRGFMCNKDGSFLCDECGVLSETGCDKCNSEWCDKHYNFHVHPCRPKKGSAASSKGEDCEVSGCDKNAYRECWTCGAYYCDGHLTQCFPKCRSSKKCNDALFKKKKKPASKRKKQQADTDEVEHEVTEDVPAETSEPEPTEKKKPKITSRSVFAPPEHHLPPAEKAQFYRTKAAEATAEAEKIEQELKKARLTPPFQLFHGAVIDGEAQELLCRYPCGFSAVEKDKWHKESGTRIKSSEKWKWGTLEQDGPLYLIDHTDDDHMITVYRNFTVVSNDPEPIRVDEEEL